ncbi:thioredoxin fold domain-containing protein [Streptococcus halotolerans]|uniref:thioredoxin fold domain-containing protein n=1 Tax=Streptococcus halotolerans TaxID=1814128 RepID=UPI0007896AB8|nr:thioredoxin fold domain-containing protein [Streptococcus halotolerans]
MSEFASAFNPISAVAAEEAIKNQEKVILFVGRPTCPYCQRFEPKLTNVVKANNLNVHYLHSEDSSQMESIQALRDKYGIKTVPGLLVAEKGQVRVVCDSSLSEEDILDFIG